MAMNKLSIIDAHNLSSHDLVPIPEQQQLAGSDNNIDDDGNDGDDGCQTLGIIIPHVSIAVKENKPVSGELEELLLDIGQQIVSRDVEH